MSLHDRYDDGGYDAFLQQVVDSGELEPAARGITRQVIERGIDSLSERQRFVFQTYVLDVYVTKKCVRDGEEIPWSEMFEAYSNGGYCSWCAHQLAKQLAPSA